MFSNRDDQPYQQQPSRQPQQPSFENSYSRHPSQQQQQQQQQLPMTQQNSYVSPFSPYQAYNSINGPTYMSPHKLQNIYYGGGNNGGNPLNLPGRLNHYQQQQQQQQLFATAQPVPFRPSPFAASFQPGAQPQSAPPAQQQMYQPPATLQEFNDEVVPTEPDEFIVELLRKPQERLFLLKLELQFEAFIQDEMRLRLDLPNMNSYQRLMVHKLAPYYKLNHYHDAMRKGVYVCKTHLTEMPSVRLQDVELKDDTNEDNAGIKSPSGGSDVNTASSSNNTNSRNQSPQFKIMRRETGTNSSRTPASNTDSGNESLNSDGKPKVDRKNMTYEERQAAYEEARARIFQDLHNKD